VKLIYIANARLPTEKAHGYQIVKMCEAFSELGVEVLLLHPHRHQDDQRMSNRTVFEYYELNPSIEIRTLPNPDVLRIERFFPSRSFVWFYFLHSLLWGLYAALKARREAADLSQCGSSFLVSTNWLAHSFRMSRGSQARTEVATGKNSSPSALSASPGTDFLHQETAYNYGVSEREDACFAGRSGPQFV